MSKEYLLRSLYAVARIFALYLTTLMPSFVDSPSAYATTCSNKRVCDHRIFRKCVRWRTESDWENGICGYDAMPGNRCVEDPVSRANMLGQCSSATDGCSECRGPVPPGHWIVTGFSDGTTKRCVCGCFAEETKFSTPSGLISGADIIAAAESNESSTIWAEAMDGIGAVAASFMNVVWGPELPLAFRIETAGGRSIILSRYHPVVLGDDNGKMTELTQARYVTPGSILVTEDGKADRVLKVTTEAYEKRMMNFQVIADAPGEHIVNANELRMGDNSLQQALVRSERRMLSRSDVEALLIEEENK